MKSSEMTYYIIYYKKLLFQYGLVKVKTIFKKQKFAALKQQIQICVGFVGGCSVVI